MVEGALRNADEEQSLKEFICKICLEMLTENEVIPLENCEHVFHAECLIGHMKSNINDSKFPICCPQPGCGQLIDQLDI